MMPRRTLLERLQNATARLDQVICIAGAIAAEDEITDSLSDLLDEGENVLRKCFGEIPQSLIDELGDRDNASWAFSEWAINENKLGFVVQIATPVMEHHGDDCETYSWGYYRTAWVYGETFDDAVDAGLAWVEKQRASEKKKKAT